LATPDSGDTPAVAAGAVLRGIAGFRALA
jgi:hypothetical protein